MAETSSTNEPTEAAVALHPPREGAEGDEERELLERYREALRDITQVPAGEGAGYLRAIAERALGE